jgi:integrase
MSNVEKKYSKRLKKDVWGFDCWIGPRHRKVRVRRWCFESRDEAEAVLAQLRLYARADEFGLERPKSRITIEDLIKARGSPTTQHEKNLLLWLKDLARVHPNKPLEALTTSDMRGFIKYMKKDRGLQDSTINHRLVNLASVFNNAYQYFPHLQDWKKPEFPYIPSVKGSRSRIYSPTEAAGILTILREPALLRRKDSAHSRHMTADVFELALLTSRRLMEIILIRKSDILLDLNLVRFNATKTHEEFYLDMLPRVRAILEARRQQAKRDNDRVFKGLRGGMSSVRILVNREFAWACEEAGVTKGRDIDGGVIFHDSRRTAITIMLQAGNDLKTVGAIARHTDATMTMLYAQPTAESLRTALRSLDDFSVQISAKKQPEETELPEMPDSSAEHKRLVNE